MRFAAKYLQTSLILALAVMFFTGCARWNSIYRPFNTDDGEGALIDIKQRAIIASKAKRNDIDIEIPMVCAEPYPDAMSVLASSTRIDVEAKGATVGLGNSIQENGSFIGLRTQTIQLLRDFLYRDCEAYMNGAIDKYQYDVLMRRNQKYMVALLAIEQLTGTQKPTFVHMSSSAPPQNPAFAHMSSGASPQTKTKTENAGKVESPGPNKGKENESGGKTEKTPATQPAPKVVASSQDLISSTVRDISLEILRTDDIGQSCFAYLAGLKHGSEKISRDLAITCNSYLEKASSMKATLDYGCLGLIANAQKNGYTPDQLKDLITSLKDLPFCTSTDDSGGGLMRIRQSGSGGGSESVRYRSGGAGTRIMPVAPD